jgi:hypothetical protein
MNYRIDPLNPYPVEIDKTQLWILHEFKKKDILPISTDVILNPSVYLTMKDLIGKSYIREIAVSTKGIRCFRATRKGIKRLSDIYPLNIPIDDYSLIETRMKQSNPIYIEQNLWFLRSKLEEARIHPSPDKRSYIHYLWSYESCLVYQLNNLQRKPW